MYAKSRYFREVSDLEIRRELVISLYDEAPRAYIIHI